MSDPIPTPQNSVPYILHSCPACKREYFVPADFNGLSCPICQQAALIASPQRPQSTPIEHFAPITLLPEALHASLLSFCKGSAFPFPDFKPENMAQRLVLLYWPIWMTDADLDGEWDAVFGFDYNVESSREYMGNTGWSSQKVIKTRVKEDPRKGFFKRHYDNVLSPALQTHSVRVSQIGHYDMETSQVWDPAKTARSVIQNRTIPQEANEEFVRKQLASLAEADCRQAADAQHPKSFTYYGEFNKMNWTLAILPMFTTYYEDDKGKRYAVAINGQSGQAYGQRVASMKKAWLIAGILFAIALVLSLVLYLSKVDFFVCAPGLIIFALIPIIRAVAWNRKEKDKQPLA